MKKHLLFHPSQLILTAVLMVGSFFVGDANATRGYEQAMAQIEQAIQLQTKIAVSEAMGSYNWESIVGSAEPSDPKEEPSVPVEVAVTPTPMLTENEINLLAQVAMAESEGESELGQRLVIDTVLNRMESGQFPDTLHEVVYQKNQFSCMWDGRFDRCYVQDRMVELVKEELLHRTNDQVGYFRTQKYSIYGTPLLNEENHWFSSI